MKLKKFQIQNYKCIFDSGLVNVSNLTAIIGRNESGKSSTLEGLYKLNPVGDDPFNIETEWPNSTIAIRKSASKMIPACKACFELDPERLVGFDLEIENIFLGGAMLQVSRFYDGEIKLSLSDSKAPCGYQNKDIQQFLQALPEIPSDFPHTMQEGISLFYKELSKALKKSRGINDFSLLPDEIDPSLFPADPDLRRDLQDFISELKEALVGGLEKLSQCKTIIAELEEYVSENLPEFTFISSFELFSGHAQFKEIKDRMTAKVLSQGDKIALMIMELAGIKLDEEIELCKNLDEGAIQERKERYKEASKAFTDHFSSHWSDRGYKVELKPVENGFYTFVSDEYDPSRMHLVERSQGFQRSFSFDLLILFEILNSTRDTILLLDEPGAHLHPESQKELLLRLEEYSNFCTIVYTTNLPHMLNLSRPERIFTTVMSTKGTRIDGKVNIDSKAKTILYSALGIRSSSAFLESNKSLVLPTIEDCWILSSISNLLIRSGMCGLPEDIFYIPAGGAAEQAYITSYIVGSGKSVVAIFNSKRRGLAAKNTLENKWSKRLESSNFRASDFGVLFGSALNVSIEDLFCDDYYLDIVQKTYAEEIKTKNITDLKVLRNGTNLKKAKRMLSELGIEFDRRRVTRKLRRTIRKTASINDFSSETCEKIENFVGFVIQAYREMSGE